MMLCRVSPVAEESMKVLNEVYVVTYKQIEVVTRINSRPQDTCLENGSFYIKIIMFFRDRVYYFLIDIDLLNTYY